MTELLRHHVVQGNYAQGALPNSVQTLDGQTLTIERVGQTYSVGTVALQNTSEGVFSADGVILPANFVAAKLTPAASTVAETTVAPTAAAVTTAAPAETTVAAASPSAETVAIYFNPGSSDLTSQSMTRLKALAEEIKSTNPSKAIRVVGFADNRGTNQMKELIANERARRVVTFLKGQGALETR
jgi:outer membrane protein OmpA-like peptidoglycan-associated protein